MGDLTGVKVGDEVVVHDFHGTRRAQVLGAGPKWVTVAAEHQGHSPTQYDRHGGLRKDGHSGSASTLAQHEALKRYQEATQRLRNLGFGGLPSRWTIDQMVAMADAADRIDRWAIARVVPVEP